MFAVAVTRARLALAPTSGYRDASPVAEVPTREELARVLAELTGRDLYSVRLRLGQPLPWVVALEPDPERALELLATLRRRGLGAVCARTDEGWQRHQGLLTLGDDALALASGARVPYRAIRVIVLATIDEETSREDVEMVRVRVSPRGGDTHVPVSRYRNETKRSRAAFVALDPSSQDQPDLRLVQGALTLAGPDPGRTSFERFDRALTALRARVPDVPCDARLLDVPRARGSFSLRGDGRERVTSNLRETDVAARLLARAWLEGQVDPT